MEYFKVIFNIVSKDAKKIDATLLQAAKDVLCGMAGDAGFESFEESEGGCINGYAQKQALNKQVLDDLISAFPFENFEISYSLEDAEYKNWNKTWEDEGFEPININGKCIIHDTIHTLTHDISYNNANNILDITIDAKLAFGTGTHETTYMIVSELLEMNLKGLTVLDCGCGTGILSIVASKLGAESVMAYDIDEWSVNNTIHNSEINNINNISVVQGDANILNQTNKKFDLIMANINRNILLNDMPTFADKMSS
ncbi:MAG: 50S ribosomal protein L11 methyltransferase, partial [Prevotella sp.]|nr:50S ribosomal protein L11 methyltransferase [Prevotella sp.]